ncbi:MAG: hypothetical protein E4H01_14255 [Lysobacterales bacterium]|nr:MAG: hypothetical protein E4H01_14255 [Xanthomonadales bacterium]
MKLNEKAFQIPVNPEYSWDEAPETQADYVNPVEAANKLMDYSNAYVEVTMRIVRANSTLVEQRAALKEVETRYVRLRSRLLRQFPPPTADRKSNALLDAYLDRTAFEQNMGDDYQALEDECQAAKDAVEATERAIESGKQMAFLIKTLGEHIQTFLSFRKHEVNLMRGT